MEVARRAPHGPPQAMTAETRNPNAPVEFGLTMVQKITYGVLLLALSTLVVPLSPVFEGAAGTVLFVLFGIFIGVCTWFISAGWMFKIEVGRTKIEVRDGARTTVVPLEKIGMIVRGGRTPFLPQIWIVVRGVEDVGRELPARGVDAHTQELLENLRRRNPGKEIRYVPVPGMYLRSIGGFLAELKRRIPPLTIDDRLGGK